MKFLLVIAILTILLCQHTEGTTYYFRRTASGSANGSSWANAYSFSSSFKSKFSSSNGGDVLYIRADEGSYSVTSTMNLDQTGTCK